MSSPPVATENPFSKTTATPARSVTTAGAKIVVWVVTVMVSRGLAAL